VSDTQVSIPPVMTSEQWEAVRSGADDVAHLYFTDDKGKVIAACNDELPDDDPRKITRDTITGIRETALLAEDALAREYGRQVEFHNGGMRERWGNVPLTLLAMVRRTHALADVLESYLPPIPQPTAPTHPIE
jgi:hypothetical protein